MSALCQTTCHYPAWEICQVWFFFFPEEMLCIYSTVSIYCILVRWYLSFTVCFLDLFRSCPHAVFREYTQHLNVGCVLAINTISWEETTFTSVLPPVWSSAPVCWTCFFSSQSELFQVNEYTLIFLVLRVVFRWRFWQDYWLTLSLT